MKLMVATYFWLLALISNGIECRRDGAPAAACAQMVPIHGVSPQTSPSPFQTSLKVDLEKRQVHLTLEAKPSNSQATFKGFLVMAFDAASSDTTAPIGTFETIEEGNLLDCSGRKNSAVTHKDNNPKDKVDMKWTAPDDFTGHVVFRTTFVQERTTFWVQQPSASIQLGAVEPDTQADTTPTVQRNRSTGSVPIIYLNVNVGSIAAQSFNSVTVYGMLTVRMFIRLLI